MGDARNEGFRQSGIALKQPIVVAGDQDLRLVILPGNPCIKSGQLSELSLVRDISGDNQDIPARQNRLSAMGIRDAIDLQINHMISVKQY